MEKIPVIIVCGATASGKTGLGIEIAKRFNAEVVSADSMQVYCRLNIGTAKPTEQQRQGIVHHMIDVAQPTESYSVARYCGEAGEAIGKIHSRGRLAVIVGGTGLYIDNLVRNTDFSSPQGDEELRRRLEGAAREKGNEYLHNMLCELDSDEAARIHPNNVKRIIRAIELIKITGESRKSLNEKSRRPSPYRALWLGIEYPRDELYRRIDQRVDIMLSLGLEDEVRRELLPIRNNAPTAIAAIGYKEMLEYMDKRVTYDEAVSNIKQASRRYAKRQLTWFRRNNEINWLTPADAEEKAVDLINKFIEKGEIQHETGT